MVEMGLRKQSLLLSGAVPTIQSLATNSAEKVLRILFMHQSIETPTLWVPGKGGGFDIDPSQKASISLPPEAIV